MLRRREYEELVYGLTIRFPEIRLSTLVVAPSAYSIARVTGMIAMGDDIVLCVHELVDFRQGCFLSYRYEVTRTIPPFIEKALPSADEYCAIHYAGKEKLYWYDSQPHPDDPTLQSTHPHHKHVAPDTIVPEEKRSGIKHNRIPAPDLSFTRPNLPFLIEEIRALLDRTVGKTEGQQPVTDIMPPPTAR